MAARALVRCSALAASAALLLWPPMSSVAGDASWRQAVDRLGQERSLAEGCASLLKTHGEPAPMARVQGERLYARAGADMDGLLTLLIADLAGDRSPAERPELGQRLAAVLEQRRALCRHVEAAIGTAVRQQPEPTRAGDLLAAGSTDAGSSLIEATVQVWQAYRRADQARRAAIIAAIDAARWPAYAQVPRAGDR